MPTAIPLYPGQNLGQPNKVAPSTDLSASKYPDLNFNNPPSSGANAYAPVHNAYAPVGYPN